VKIKRCPAPRGGPNGKALDINGAWIGKGSSMAPCVGLARGKGTQWAARRSKSAGVCKEPCGEKNLRAHNRGGGRIFPSSNRDGR